MAWKIRGRREHIISEINITPLTDVMLVLLVIFMVATPLIMNDSFKIRLPKAVSSDAEPGKGIVIAVSEAGRVSVNGREVAPGALKDALAAEFGRGAQRNVIIRADGRAMHASVVRVLDIARLSGAERLSIATDEEGAPGR